MTELIDTLQEIPLAGMIPLALGVIVGLLLWAAGRKILRTGFAAVGLVLGLAIGFIVGDTWNLGLPAWAVALIAAMVLAAMAIVLYRAALAGMMAMILAIACPMAAVAIYELQGNAAFVERAEEPAPAETEPLPEEKEDDPWWDRTPREHLEDGIREHIPHLPPSPRAGEPPTDDDIDEWLEDGHDEPTEEEATEESPRAWNDQLAHFRSFGEQLLAGFREAWDSTAPPLQPVLMGAAVGGMIFGFVIGALLPGVSAAIVTAFGGSLLWIGSIRIISERLTWGDMGILPTTGKGWLALWIIAAIIGLAIQWMIGGKQADKSA